MSNINSNTQDLASIAFPKTLSDAIKVCHEIGIRHIWIDALCIVQDDPKDKAREISQMGRTYKYATLTIMAASTRSVYEGFLGDAKIDAPKAKLPFHLIDSTFSTTNQEQTSSEHQFNLEKGCGNFSNGYGWNRSGLSRARLPDGDLKALVLGMTFSNSGAHYVIFLVLHRLECDTYERIGHAVLHTEFTPERVNRDHVPG